MWLSLSLLVAACLVPAAPREVPVVEEVDTREGYMEEVVVKELGREVVREEEEELQVIKAGYSCQA